MLTKARLNCIVVTTIKMSWRMRVSTIIPTFNNEATLARAIDSALAQDFDDPTEVIVVNDGSTDATVEILAATVIGFG